jgi:hypothetical protein
MSEIKVNKISPRSGTTVTLGDSGDTFTIPSGATISGLGAVQWDTTKKTADFTGESGRGYFIDTGSGAVTITLPASPSAGNTVAVVDYAGTASNNNITIGRNSSKINGDTSDLVITKNDSGITLVFVDATEGWKNVETSNLGDITLVPEYMSASGGTQTNSPCGDFKIHTFTGPGTFCVSAVGNPAGSDKIQFIAAGGGGGGGNDNGGGGGGSGVIKGACSPVSVQAYPIAIGAGGAGQPAPGCNTTPGARGTNSTFYSITVLAGGGGRSDGGASSPNAPYGNGGGGAGVSSSGPGDSGAPITPVPGTVTAFSNNAGGNGTNGTCSVFRAGGGGGAGGAGNPGLNIPTYSVGGAGTPDNISGSTLFYGGGGGGGAYCSAAGAGGTGGAGGGGAGPDGASGGAAGASGTNAGTAGAAFPSGQGGPAGANTGSGGGGGGRSGSNGGGNGGSGITIIKYKFQN